jgi:hypothetical protein
MDKQMLKQRWLVEYLHFLALLNLAVAQPLYELIGGDPDFLVVRDSTFAELIIAVIVISFLLPAILLLIGLAAGWISQRLREFIHLFFIATLFSLILLRAFNLTLALHGVSIVVLAGIAGALFAYLYYSFAVLRTFLTWLGAVAVIIPALFLLNSDVEKAVAAPPPISLKKSNATTPVVLIIFDELPLSSLLNAEGDIDSLRYPNFAQLRADSTWYRNATSVSGETARAVTAILTGLYPEKRRLTRLEDYPDNIFTMLGGSHEMKVIEPMTKLRPLSSLLKKRSFSEKIASLLSDLSAIYLNLVVPEELADWLPRVDNQWTDFWASKKRSSKYARFYVRLEQYGIFLNAIQPSAKPGLYVIHSMMPHAPWLILPSGKEYEPDELQLSREPSRRQTWRGDKWAMEGDYLRHLLQVGYVDQMVGQLIQRLKQANLYDTSVIAITADHGICFNPNQVRKARRHVTADNADCLLPVPLFIRYPGQKAGTIDDSPLQTIDIVPTLADLLKVELPSGVNGISAFNPKVNRRTDKIAYSSKYIPFNFPRDIDFMGVVRRKISLFGNAQSPYWLMALAQSSAIGKNTGEFTIQPSKLKAELFGSEAYKNVNVNSRYIPSLIGGQLPAEKSKANGLVLAISINGTICGVTQTFAVSDSVQGFAAIVPENSFRNGKNVIEIFQTTSNPRELREVGLTAAR